MTITVNTLYQYDNANQPRQISVTVLSSTKALEFHKNNTGSNYYAVVLNISGTVITPGSRQLVAGGSGTIDGGEVVVIDSSTAICALASSAADVPGNAYVLSVSGDTVTPGSAETFSANEVTSVSLCLLSSTQAFAAWVDQDDVNKVKGCVLDISGTTITAGTAGTINSGSCANVDVEALDSSTVVVHYADGGNSNYPTANTITISGSSIDTVGADEVIESSAASTSTGGLGRKRLIKLSSSTMLSCWMRASDGIIRSAVLSISGTTTTAGTVVSLSSGSFSFDEYGSIAGSGSVAAVLYDDGNSIGKIQSISISGTTITANGDTTNVDTNTPFYEAIAEISIGKYIGCHTRGTSGYAFIATTDSGTYTHSASGIPGSIIA